MWDVGLQTAFAGSFLYKKHAQSVAEGMLTDTLRCFHGDYHNCLRNNSTLSEI